MTLPQTLLRFTEGSMSRVLIAALYKFVPLKDYADMREPLFARAQACGIRGTLLLAREGINGTLAGPEKELRELLAYLRSDPRLSELRHKESWSDEMPFVRLKVRLKKEIVTIGVPEVNPRERVGTYVKPKDWNDLISDPSVVVIDTRNDYEVDIGTFRGAIDPKTTSFTAFPKWATTAPELKGKKRVAMFCTGGIRCEKASSFLLGQGVDEVFHLEGGILKYLEEVPKSESMWEGDCFVFDRRVSVDHDLRPGDYTMCSGCRRPVHPNDRHAPEYEEGISCPACHQDLTGDQRERFAERHLQIQLARERGERFWGRNPRSSEATTSDHTASIRFRPVLYSFRRCPYAIRARMAIHASGLSVELREVVLQDKPAHLLALSPKGTVPVLWLPDGSVLEESLDVMKWALQQHDPQSWWPSTDQQRAEAMTLVERNDEEFKFHLDRYKYANRYDGTVAETHRDEACAFLETLDGLLAGRAFLHGSHRGLLDAAILPFVRQFANVDRRWFDTTPFPNLRAWSQRELEAISFTSVMTKYAPWRPGDPEVEFPLQSLQPDGAAR